MKASSNAIELIKSVEGVRLKAYNDGGGVWTIGWGHTLNVKEGDSITLDEATTFLQEDVKSVDIDLAKYVRVRLTQNQYDALACFVFNIGGTQFGKSTLLKLLNNKDYDAAANQFAVWNKDNGKVVQGLVNRRAKEKLLFLSKTT